MTMAECPWCRGPVQDVRAPCPKCGKLATDLRTTDPPEPMPRAAAVADVPDLVIPAPSPSKPSVSPSKKATPPPPVADLGDDFGLGGAGGDLQIDLSNVQPTKPNKPGVARPPTAADRGGAADQEIGFSPFDDDISGGPALELDVTGGSLPPRISSPNVSTAPAASLPAPPPPMSSSRSLPAPSAPERPAVDAFEAKAFADYGPAPTAFWLAPLYAYRVVTRRAALRRDLHGKKSEVEQTSKRVEDALVSLGERGRALAKGGEAALARVREAEDLLRSRDGALAGAMDAHRSALGEIDARLAAAESELARARDEEARATTARDAADEDHKRSDAKLKRLEIEIRNGAPVATTTGRDAERGALASDVALKAARRAEAEQKLADARRVVGAAQSKLDAATAERRAQEARFSRQSGARSEGVDDAQTHLRAALVELGRAMLSDPSLAAELSAARDEVARLEEQSRKRSHELALHETALTAYDAPQVMLGVILIGVALVLLGILVFFPFIYRALAT